jgi:hypothetical protein
MRRTLDANWHEGPIHDPKPDGFYDDWRDAVADNFDYMRVDVKTLKYMRDPEQTPRLSDLEKEFGQVGTGNLTEAERRTALKTKRYRRSTTGNISDLQALLDAGGYNLTAYNNSPDGPPVDPALILNETFALQAQSGNYYAGNDDAYAGTVGGTGGYYLVNGAANKQVPGYFGAGDVFAGNTNAVAGFFEKYVLQPVVYDNPTDPEDWSFVVFIGGAATFAPDGQILTIAQGQVPAQQRRQLETLLLSFKGLYIWLGMVVQYT